MKNIFNTISKLTFIYILIILSSCEAEKDFATQDKIIVRRFSMKDITAKSNSKLNQAINNIKTLNSNTITDSSNSKLVFDEKTGLYFDDEKGLYIEKDNLKSYTFPIIRTSADEKIKNICFNEKQDGNYDVFLVKYDLTKQEELTLTEEQKESREKQFITLMKDGVAVDLFRFYCINIVMTVTTEYAAPIDNGDLTGNFGYTTGSNTTSVVIGSGCFFDNGNSGSGFNQGLITSGNYNNTGTIIGTNPVPVPAEDIITGLNTLDFDNPLTDGDIFYYNYYDFMYHLNQEQKVLFRNRPELINYLVSNHWSSTSVQFVRWSIDYIIDNSSSTNSISLVNSIINPPFFDNTNDRTEFCNQNINYLIQNNFSNESLNLIQLVTNNISNSSNNLIEDPNIILLEPDQTNSINDIEKYLDCFDLTQNASFTIYVDQPTANSNEPWSGNISEPNVGHTFISIKQGNIRRVIGLYPSAAVSLSSPDVSGSFHNDSNHEFDVSLSFIIDPSKLTNLINYIKTQSSGVYNLNTNNCTDFGLASTRIAGVNLPSAYGTWGIGSVGGAGDNPGQLGQNIRNMPTPVGAIKTTTGGNSLSNMGNCN